MCGARQISARGVSLGVQRHVLVLSDRGGSRVTARGSAAPLVFWPVAMSHSGRAYLPSVHRTRASAIGQRFPWWTWRAAGSDRVIAGRAGARS